MEEHKTAPKLLTTEHEFHCGYAPRTIQISREGDSIFVGCKDGSIKVIDGLVPAGSGKLPARPRHRDLSCISRKNQPGTGESAETQVRAICALDRRWLLIGQEGGQLFIQRWRDCRDSDAEYEDEAHPVALNNADLDFRQGGQGAGPVTLIDWITEKHIVISYRQWGSLIIDGEELLDAIKHAGSITQRCREIREETSQQRVRALCCALAIKPSMEESGNNTDDDTLIFVSEGGTVWHADRAAILHDPDFAEITGPLPIWPTGESPGFVTDATLVRPRGFSRTGEPGSGVYLGTDNGVYLLTCDDLTKLLTAFRVSLPGVGNMCMAVSHCAADNFSYLWVSDSGGAAHVFWDKPRPHEIPNWRRSGIRHDESQVVLAVASWIPMGSGFVVGQARRNDRIVISTYQPIPTEKEKKLKEPLFVPTLTRGTFCELKQYVRKKMARDKEGDCDSWEPEALLAEFFETSGENERNFKNLIEFLAYPTADLAKNTLDKCELDAKAAAIDLWTKALVGTIHRWSPRWVNKERESDYLGIIRWLRVIGDTYARDEEPPQDVLDAVEHNIRFARKWGLFGGTYAKRTRLWKPLQALRDREKKRFDQLVYDSIAFERYYDLEFEDSTSQFLGRTAWDVKTMNLGQIRVIAVSWASGGIEVFQNDGSGECDADHKIECRAVLEPQKGKDGVWWLQSHPITPDTRKPEEDRRILMERNVRADYGHARSLVLGRLRDGEGYLMAAPAQEPNHNAEKRDGFMQGQERILLWRLKLKDNVLEVDPMYSPDVPEEIPFLQWRPPGDGSNTEAFECESVYSFLNLEPGLVLAGLRGVGGVPSITLIQITHDEVHCLIPDKSLKAASPEGKTIARNRIWSLARGDKTDRGSHVVFAGCGDGLVLQLEIEITNLDKREFTVEQSTVERLGVPVWAVACRRSQGRYRVFAGGSDGTIVAWQEPEVPQCACETEENRLHGEVDERTRPSFRTLWATTEQDSPVARIHTFQFHPKTDSRIPMVVVVTQHGRIIFFDDRDSFSESNEPSHWLTIPGLRYGRVKLPDSTFASFLLHLRSGDDESDEETVDWMDPPVLPPIRLFTASGDGRIRIYSFNYLLHHSDRKDRHDDLIDAWKEGTLLEAPNFKGHLLRRAECAHASAPGLARIYVRWLFPPDLQHKDEVRPTQAPDYYRQWLPRHIRPLLDLTKIFSNNEEQDVGDYGNDAAKRLELALERAWGMHDKELFVEILEVVLRLTNRRLLDGADPISGSEKVHKSEAQSYEAMLSTIDRSIQRWLGAPNRQAERIRMMFAKNLIDGDTLWQLAMEAYGSGDKPSRSFFKSILKCRDYVTRQFLVQGNPLLSLETLRAANLALIRVCLQLNERRQRDGGWKPTSRKHEIPWKAMENFFKSLSDYAARVLHSNSGTNDAQKHEISRAYALGLCACPSAAIRLAFWMSEADLITSSESFDDLSALVKSQCEMLHELSLEVPNTARELFIRASSAKVEESLRLESLLEDGKLFDQTEEGLKKHEPSDRSPAGQVVRIYRRLKGHLGEQNAVAISGMTIIYSLIDWLRDLTLQLSGSAENIDLWLVTDLVAELELLGPGRLPLSEEFGDIFKHSYRFWIFALSGRQKTGVKVDDWISFIDLIKGVQEEGPTDNVRPDVVLLSRDLTEWSNNCCKVLESRSEENRIFHPQIDIYRETLQGLSRAADDFRYSSAIQKNIVFGVLNHGLLGSLDEHVLELEEIAQALDPHLVWGCEDDEIDIRDFQDRSAAERFSLYLLRSSRDAESIPKNLRTLQSIIYYSGTASSMSSPRDREFEEVVSNEIRKSGSVWINETPRRQLKVSQSEASILRLIVSELDHNDRIYGLLPLRKRGKGDQPAFYIRAPRDSKGDVTQKECVADRAAGVRIRFRTKFNDDLTDRIKELGGLQKPVSPRRVRNVPSHGSGLYLSNLAAAVIDWRLRVDAIEEERDVDLGEGKCYLNFHLERVR